MLDKATPIHAATSLLNSNDMKQWYLTTNKEPLDPRPTVSIFLDLGNATARDALTKEFNAKAKNEPLTYQAVAELFFGLPVLNMFTQHVKQATEDALSKKGTELGALNGKMPVGHEKQAWMKYLGFVVEVLIGDEFTVGPSDCWENKVLQREFKVGKNQGKVNYWMEKTMILGNPIKFWIESAIKYTLLQADTRINYMDKQYQESRNMTMWVGEPIDMQGNMNVSSKNSNGPKNSSAVNKKDDICPLVIFKMEYLDELTIRAQQGTFGSARRTSWINPSRTRFQSFMNAIYPCKVKRNRREGAEDVELAMPPHIFKYSKDQAGPNGQWTELVVKSVKNARGFIRANVE